MNCYSIPNPSNGQKCTDDVLGEIVYNASDGTWEKLDGYTKDGNNYSFDLSTLPGNMAKATGTFFQKYGLYVIGVVAFIAALMLLSFFGKK